MPKPEVIRIAWQVQYPHLAEREIVEEDAKHVWYLCPEVEGHVMASKEPDLPGWGWFDTEQEAHAFLLNEELSIKRKVVASLARQLNKAKDELFQLQLARWKLAEAEAQEGE